MTLALGEDFDRMIEALDPQLFQSPEAQWLPHDFLTAPHAHFRALRETYGPVFERSAVMADGHLLPNPFLLDEAQPIWFVLDYEPAVAVWHDGATFSNTAYQLSVGLVFGRSLTMCDGAEHARYRSLIMQGFKRAAVTRWTEEIIEPVARHLVERLAQAGGGDLVRELAAPLPFKVMAQILGLPDEQFPTFVRLASDLLHIGYDFGAAFAAKAELGEFLTGRIEEARRTPGDDLISALVHAEIDGERLPDEIIIANLTQLLPAGIETTYRSTGNLWFHLLTTPGQFTAVVADPGLAPAAVEEGLRIDGPAFMTPRLATVDTELCGTPIAAGSGVLACQGMANRDGARWPDPDLYDLHREAKPHASFIAGAHTCLGLHLARVEMQAMLRALVTGLPGARLAIPAEEVPIIGFMLRSPAACPVIV
jgi:cytochrome P450